MNSIAVTIAEISVFAPKRFLASAVQELPEHLFELSDEKRELARIITNFRESSGDPEHFA